MSDISLVSQNRIAQFAARFEMQQDGSVIYYHPDRAHGGLPCTLEEAEQLIQCYASSYASSMKWMMYWAIISGIVLGVLDASEIWQTTRWLQMLIIIAPFPFVVYRWYLDGQKPLQLLGTRLPCSPPRSAESAFWNRVYALPASLIITMLLPSAGLIYYSIQDGWQKLHWDYLAIIASTLFMTVIWLYARFGRGR